jgi:metal-dependent hydrolase (beta-lactamase superfamily II)
LRALITAIYDRWTNNGFRHIISHGVFFHLAIGQNQLMFDLGLLDHFLMKNIQKLEINPNEILKIVFSHAHADHT